METKLIPSKTYFCVTTETTLNQLNEIADKEVGGLYEAVSKYGIKPEGPVEFIYIDCSADMSKPFTLHIAFPVATKKEIADPKYKFIGFQDFKSCSYIHKGSLSNIFNIYEDLYNNIYKDGLQPSTQVREVYHKYVDMHSQENITEIQIGLN